MHMVFNLKKIYPRCSGGPDFTPSLLHFPLDIWKPGGSSHMKRQGMLVGKVESGNCAPTPHLTQHVIIS